MCGNTPSVSLDAIQSMHLTDLGVISPCDRDRAKVKVGESGRPRIVSKIRLADSRSEKIIIHAAADAAEQSNQHMVFRK